MVKARSRDRALFEHADSRKFAQFASTILRFELLQETFRGEIPARTAGVNRVDLLMHPDGVDSLNWGAGLSRKVIGHRLGNSLTPGSVRALKKRSISETQ